MQVGEIYQVRTDSMLCEGTGPNTRPKVKGRVTWVHPRGRFAVLELPGGARECFYPEQLTERNRVGKKKARRIRIVC